jgi:hypothetical protein
LLRMLSTGELQRDYRRGTRTRILPISMKPIPPPPAQDCWGTIEADISALPLSYAAVIRHGGIRTRIPVSTK